MTGIKLVFSPLVYTPKEVADILRYHVETIHTMLKAGKLKVTKPGGNAWRITGQAILDVLGMDPKGVGDE